MFNPQMTLGQAKASLVYLDVITDDVTFIDSRLIQATSNPSLYLLSDDGDIYCVSHDGGNCVEINKVYNYLRMYGNGLRYHRKDFILFMKKTFEHKAHRLESKRLRDNPNITHYDFS
jgi:hypothetical protein